MVSRADASLLTVQDGFITKVRTLRFSCACILLALTCDTRPPAATIDRQPLRADALAQLHERAAAHAAQLAPLLAGMQGAGEAQQ
jgi:hypothetical protein